MPGPYVQVATICEKVLQEADGVLSIIRAIDRFTLVTPAEEAPAELPEGGQLPVTLAIVLKAGEARGRHPIVITLYRPDGTYPAPQTIDVMFEGDDRGVNLILQVQVAVVEGLHWFDVKINEQTLTRIPLRIIYQRIPRGA